MAQNTDLESLRFKLVPEHTKSWHRQNMLLGSMVRRSWVGALVELKILKKLGIHLIEEKRVVLR